MSMRGKGFDGLPIELKRAYGLLGHVKVKGVGCIEIRPGESEWYTVSGENLKLLFCLVKKNIEVGPVTASEVLSTYGEMFRGAVPRRYFYYFIADFLGRLNCISVVSGKPRRYEIRGELFSENADSKEGLEKLYAGVKRALGLKTNESTQKGGRCEEEVQNKNAERNMGSFDKGCPSQSHFRSSSSSQDSSKQLVQATERNRCDKNV